MIDVIIPAYNCSKTLSRTLSSLAAQTDTDFCVTVVDDCSTENIKDIVYDYKDKLNITYIRNEKNLGCGMSRQTGIDNTTCTHFTFLDSDDVFMPYTVETFNAIVKANPDTEYVHSYFYEQTIIDGNPAMILHKDGFTWCHGKLYNRNLIEKYQIKNSPLIKWADDSFFNSMCSELLNLQVISIPTVLWCNNKSSVTREKNEERDKKVVEDFLLAMNMSMDFVMKYKNCVNHLENTINLFNKDCQNKLNKKEYELLQELKKRW